MPAWRGVQCGILAARRWERGATNGGRSGTTGQHRTIAKIVVVGTSRIVDANHRRDCVGGGCRHRDGRMGHLQRWRVVEHHSNARRGPISRSVPGLRGRWYDSNGTPLPDGMDRAANFPLTMHVLQGAEDCGWQSATFMNLAWPLGSVTHDANGIREYVSDPNGLFSREELSRRYGLRFSLPDDATYTGYHRGEWQLWVSSTHIDEAVYVVGPGAIQAWPRAKHLILCK